MSYYWRWVWALGLVVVLLDIVLLAGFATPHWAFDALRWGAAGFVSLWWSSRAWLVWQHGQRRDDAICGASDSGEIVELPQQENAIERLISYLMPANALDGRIVALRGSWGMGKTVILRRLVQRLEACAEQRFAAVWINVWRAETADDLHRAFYEALLHAPTVFRECWLALPWLLPRAFLLGRMVRSLRLAFRNSHAEAEMSLRPDALFPLTMQHQVEWIVHRMRRRGFGVVVILEEIDRAAPAVTRHAIVSAERSFKLPGMTVILPYVQEHLWTKAFNPLEPGPPDLEGTLESLLQQELLAEERKKAIGGKEETPVESPPPSYDASRQSSAKSMLADWQKDQWLRRFVMFDEHRRNRLYRRFSEKYLGGYRVDIGVYSSKDIAALITKKPSLFHLAKAKFPLLADMEEDEAREVVHHAVTHYHPKLTVRHLRHFESYYIRLLEGVPADLGSDVKSVVVPPTVSRLEKIRSKSIVLDRFDEVLDLLVTEKLPKYDLSLQATARFLAAIAALAAWYEAMMHAES
ncbi:MAG: P-loop NTPase fold protein [Rhodocyclaceae bacterium]|nr:P-loop NTPase fold protein [Rhodocyclaceae bacterium]